MPAGGFSSVSRGPGGSVGTGAFLVTGLPELSVSSVGYQWGVFGNHA